jgi:hypothetical protein
MKSKQEIANEILGLLKKDYTIRNKDEFGVELEANDHTHLVRLQDTTITFSHPTNAEIYYSMGANAAEVRTFLRGPKNFDEATYEKAKLEAEAGTKPKKEKAPKEAKVPKVKAEKVPKVPKEKKEKIPAAPKADKGPSVRGEVLRLLDLGTSRDDILKHLLTLGTGREEKSLKNQISLNVGHWNEIQEKKKAAAGVTKTDVVVADAAAPVAEPATK